MWTGKAHSFGGETLLQWSRLYMNCEQYVETNAGEKKMCLWPSTYTRAHTNRIMRKNKIFSEPCESIRGVAFFFFPCVYVEVLKFNMAQKLKAGYNITYSTHKYKSWLEKIFTQKYPWRSWHFLPTEMIWQVLRSLY